MPIRLIVTDIDGTFFDDDHHYDIHAFNQQLKTLHDRGIHFAVASGNELLHLQKIFTKSAVHTFIAENGANVIDGQHIIAQKTLDRQVVKAVLHHVYTHKDFQMANIRLSGIHGMYVDETDPSIHDPITQYYLNNMCPVKDLLMVNDDLYKVNLDWPDRVPIKEAKEVNRLFGKDLFATPSGFGSMDVIPKGVDKAWGLTQLQKYWQIQPDEIMAFGDNFNDLEMLQHAKYGYVMKNAPEKMKAYGLPITRKDNNHNGVLDMIHQYLTGTLSA